MPLRPTDLRCNALADPPGLNEPPRFSWALEGFGRGRAQTAYRLIVAPRRLDVTQGRGTFWDSGRIEGADTVAIPYGGPPLGPDLELYWSVRVWDEVGTPSVFAPPARLRTGLRGEDWHAHWIARYFVPPTGREPPADSRYDNPWQARPADYLRRVFRLDKPVARATLYATALGLYELHANGAVLGDTVFDPGWTDYHIRAEYQSYDLTPHLRQGENVLGAVLGEGWYSGRVGSNRKKAGQHYGGRPAFLCQLHITFADGTSRQLTTDPSWRCALGPIAYSDFLVGEHYNAGWEMPGWDAPGFDASAWSPVETFTPEPRPPKLDAARAQPVRRKEELPARLLGRRPSGALIYDAGQNLAGRVRLEVTAAAGDRFTLRHAETLTPEGELYTENLRSAPATDTYVARGGAPESYEPHFTFHGFRYIEVTAPEGFDPAGLALTAVALYSDLPATGEFSCGHPMVTQLASNILWSQRGNFLSVPTDCPQRDERMGWTADAQVFLPTAGYFMDVEAFFAKWMVDIEDGQSPEGAFPDIAPTKPLNSYRLTPQPGAPGWGDAGVIIPWEIYLRYGDPAILSRHYAAMRAWLGYTLRANPDLIRRRAVHNNYGDWLSVGPASDRALVATAYWIHIVDIMAQAAAALGRPGDALGDLALLARLRAAFAGTFLEPDGRLAGDTQTAYLLALAFGCLEAEPRAAAARHLVRKIDAAGGHLQTGFLGVKHLCPVLSEIGATSRAYDLLLKETYPSWGSSIRHGATTIWERWDGWTPEKGFQSPNMNSFNHYTFGSVGEWLFARVAGIEGDPRAPGYRRLRMRPLFDARIGWCRASYRAVTGPIESEWRMDAAEIHWRIALPPGVAAEVELPHAAAAISLDSAPLRASPDISGIVEKGGLLRFTCAPGRYAFTLSLAEAQAVA